MAETVLPQSVESGVAGIHTFLIADVRGYTRFTVAHGDAAAARLAKKFASVAGDVIAARDGELIELRGDEALAVFTSARQALRAATDLQSRVIEESRADPELAMKIGIGLDAGEAIPVDGGFRGAALNLAARLCSLAGAGEVLASDTVVSLARRLEGLDYLERGMVPLKGFTDPVRVMQIVPEAVRGEERRDEIPLPIGGFLGALPAGPLVARGAELTRVLDPLDAVAGGAGRLVMLAGEPGAGKTRLAQEVTLESRNRGFIVATGACYEARQSVPYYPFLDALATLYGAAPDATRSSIPVKWPQLARLLPEAGIGPAGMDSDGQQEQERLFRSVAGFIQSLTEVGPVALFLDDLHWADGSSLEMLRHLAKHTRGHRVLILTTYRDVEVGRQHPLEEALLDLTREGLLERVPIRRLDHDGTHDLITATFGEQEVSPEFVDLVYQHTEGNPFFTQEVLRAMVDRGDVFQRGDTWDRRALEEIEVPESVRAVIGRRLSRLEETAQETLRQASVLGPAFNFDDLAAMSDLSETEIERALEEGEAAGLIRDLGRDRYAFNHALTQQSLYAELSSRRRRRLHLAAGEAIESVPERKRSDRTGELAWHFLEGDDPERGLRYSLAAGHEARELFAWSEARRHLEAALELANELADEQRGAEASYRLGEALLTLGNPVDAISHLENAAQLYKRLGDPLGQGRALQLATFANVQGRRRDRSDALRAQSEVLQEQIGRLEPSLEQVRYFSHESTMYWGSGQLEPAQEMGKRAAAAANALGNEALVVRAELELGERLGITGRILEALNLAESMIPRAEALGDMEAVYLAYSGAAEFSMMAGRLRESLAFRQRDREAAQAMGWAFQSAFALCNLAQVTLYLGLWDESRAYAEEALEQPQAATLGFVVRAARMNLGQVALAQGAWNEARDLLQQAEDDSAGPLQMGRYVQAVRATLDIREGRAASAIERLDPLVAQADPDDNDLGAMLPVLALAHVVNGDIEHGRELARRVLDRMPENALARAEAWPALGLALYRQDRHEEAVEAFREGVELAHRIEYPYAEAMSLALWGREARSRELLEEALQIFRRLGARKDIEQTEGLLAGIE